MVFHKQLIMWERYKKQKGCTQKCFKIQLVSRNCSNSVLLNSSNLTHLNLEKDHSNLKTFSCYPTVSKCCSTSADIIRLDTDSLGL